MVESNWESLRSLFFETRQATLDLVKNLSVEDFTVQTEYFVSPPKWHLGHTTWFFELFLEKFLANYQTYNSSYHYVHNSYYNGFGKHIPRERRGWFSRPTVQETFNYRSFVEEQMDIFFGSPYESKSNAAYRFLQTGIHHEMQHQELLLMDMKSILGKDYPVPQEQVNFVKTLKIPNMAAPQMVSFEGGLGHFGVNENSKNFSYDNEKPMHRQFLEPFSMANRLVTIGEYLEFMKQGGYQNFRFWKSDGWDLISETKWQAPLYWQKEKDQWFVEYLGVRLPAEELSEHPVSHVSYYEADAFAKWANKRLPTEYEWEFVSKKYFPEDEPKKPQSKLLDLCGLNPDPATQNPQTSDNEGRIFDLVGNLWEWTSSEYSAYPGFRSEFDEYNDKWMINQKTLRGGSFATPKDHIRISYRNFFYPRDRWQFSGIRLAESD